MDDLGMRLHRPDLRRPHFMGALTMSFWKELQIAFLNTSDDEIAEIIAAIEASNAGETPYRLSESERLAVLAHKLFVAEEADRQWPIVPDTS
jgi:hypothetical protein